MDIIRAIEAKQIKENAENFNVGDTVRVSFKIVEGTTERIQVFEGIVIAKNNVGVRRTFVVSLSFVGLFYRRCRTWNRQQPKRKQDRQVRQEHSA